MKKQEKDVEGGRDRQKFLQLRHKTKKKINKKLKVINFSLI